MFKILKRPRKHHEREPLLAHHKQANDEETPLVEPSSDAAVDSKPRIRDILSYQTILNLVVYTFLAMYSLAYDQVHCSSPALLH